MNEDWLGMRPTSDLIVISQQLGRAVRLRPATEGRPEDGFYPATIDEAADEVLAWLREMDQTAARGLSYAVLVKLGDAFDPEPPPTWSSNVDAARWLRGACSSGNPLRAAIVALCDEVVRLRRQS